MITGTVNMKEANDLINYTIDNNRRLEEEGKMPIALGLEATAGIGKTSIVQQIAEERNMGFTKIDLHQMEEAGDLIGFPITEYECQVKQLIVEKDGSKHVVILPNTVWVNAKQLTESPGQNMKYVQTGKTRMSYAKPAWVPEFNENGNIVLLDDFVRANPQLLQATMDLVLEQKYVSWSFPKKTTIILTNNPDDGNSNVNSLDEAQRTRFMNYSVTWDQDAWSRWAEKANIDGRCINFVMSYSNELFNANDDGDRICNPRSFVMFANMISGIKDWDVPENLNFISLIARGCFKDEGGRFSQMFTSFIRNKMHLLIQPKDMLLGGWDKTKATLESALYDSDGRYRPDIASILERRFSNYVDAWLDSGDKTPIATVKDRILNFIENEEKGGRMLFNCDLLYHMLKQITSSHKNQTNKLLFEPKIAKVLA